MDCRKSLVLALGLLGTAGCVSPSAPSAPTPVAAEKAKDVPRHPPKNAESCVAIANYLAAEASGKPAGSAEQERLYDQARREYQQAIDVDPNYMPTYHALGQLYTTIGDHSNAVSAYRKGLDKRPKEAPLWFDLGMCHARAKEWDRAIDALKRAAELDPENRQYQKTLGYCLASAGQLGTALEVFRKSCGEARAHYELARVLHYPMNRDAEARQHLETALSADPTLEPARQLMAQLDGRAPDAPGVGTAVFEEPYPTRR
jgi:tetratricopeptide (TPR) repeat protein